MPRPRAPKSSKLDPAPAKDALEQAILDALERHLDPDLFEKCAADLLSSEYPTLTPVRGGSDGGFDGEFWTDNPQANPLVTTTGRDVEANLKKNLGQAVRNERGRFSEAVFATSRRVTPQKRAALKELAQSLGVTKLAIHDKDWFATRLHANPVWCQKLLGVTGRPSALTQDVPTASGRQFASELVGRDAVVAALESSQRDVILVGAPGIGKTSVLGRLNTRSNGYFAIDADRTALADAIRSTRPSVVVVDDAGVSNKLLRSVLTVRSQILGQFRVVASCWDTQREEVAHAFGEYPTEAIQLGPLPADTIVQVVNGVGLAGPTELVRRIVRQAEGRPGLAVTLARSALGSNVQEVLTGQALLRYITPILRTHLGNDSTRLLGCFALGGKQGMPIPVVAEYLHRSLDDVANVLSNLAAAGVIRPEKEDTISVWPEPLRFALVAKTFFSVPRLSYEGLVREAPSRTDTLTAVIGARWAGATIPELLTLVEECDEPEVWTLFAHLGESECRRALKHRPDLLDKLAPVSLHFIPSEVLPMLFEQAAKSRDIPGLINVIRAWAREIEDADLMVQRSQTLIDAAMQWHGRKITPEVALSAACVAIEPQFSMSECDPGFGMSVRLSNGMLVGKALDELDALWSDLVTMLRVTTHVPWRQLLDAVRNWCLPNPFISLGNDTEARLRIVACKMIRDLWGIAQTRNAVQYELRELAKAVHLELDTVPEDVFGIIYPNQSPAGWKASIESHAIAARSLAARWANEPPTAIARQLVGFAEEVVEVDLRIGSMLRVIANELATRCSNPLEYLEEFMKSELAAEVVWPFAKRCADQNRPDTVKCLLATPKYASIALEMAILGNPLDFAMLDNCIRADSCATKVLSMCLPHMDSQDLLHHLLEHEEHRIAVCAAIGLWQHENRAGLLNELRPCWESAFLRSAESKLDHGVRFWLEQILRENRHLAFNWLMSSFRSDSYPDCDVTKLAARLLDPKQRSEVLAAIPHPFFNRKMITELVKSDPELFRQLLNLPSLRAVHLYPLEGHPSDAWVALVLVALQSGYSEPDIAHSTLPTGWSWSGELSDMWRGWIESASRFLDHDSRSIRRIAKSILTDVNDRHAKALESERRKQIYGIRDDD